MKNQATAFLFILVFILLSFHLIADGVITNGTRLRVHSGTYFVESGNRSIQDGAFLNIFGNVTINGNLSNLGNHQNMIIESDVDGTGSLIFSSGAPLATVERYITDGIWHMITPAVDNVISGQYYFNDEPYVWLKKYVEATDSYEYITSLSTPLPRGKGYAFGADDSKVNITTEISGNLSSEAFSLSDISSPSIQYSNLGYNLIGNPYSSNIDWDDPNWTFTDVEESIWIWDPLDNGGNFKVRNSSGPPTLLSGIIPTSQGFFVRAFAPGASMTIPTSAKTHSNQSYYKSDKAAQEALQYLQMRISRNNLWDEIWIGFSDNASDEFDNGLDISKLMGESDAPQLYCVEGDLKLTMDFHQTLEVGESKTVAVNFQATQNGMYDLNLMNHQNIDEMLVLLEDLKYNTVSELNSEEPISFFAAITDDYQRFLIHFNPVETGIENIDNEKCLIYSAADLIYIHLKGEIVNEVKEIKIFDLTGRLIHSESLNAGNIHQIPIHINNQALIIKLQFPNKSFTKKLIIR